MSKNSIVENHIVGDYVIENRGDYYCGHFFAMASPCELLMDTQDGLLANKLTQQAVIETKRIEQKYSRYLKDNLMFKINNSEGVSVKIDHETYRLLLFANTCYRLSSGLFDITSGVLRKAWKFDGSDNIPSEEQVGSLLPLVGWDKVKFDQEKILLPIGYEIDFGGIGKEYAVDIVAKQCIKYAPDVSVLVNFGGDIQVTRPRTKNAYWQVAIETPNKEDRQAIVKIAKGGLATSGDANRFLIKDGKRYGHILHPKTGYPIENAPRSVTVAADHCIQSGLLATLTLLQGREAEVFIDLQNVKYWCYR